MRLPLVHVAVPNVCSALRPRLSRQWKPSTDTLCGHEGEMLRPKASQQLDFEGELVVIMGKGGRAIPADKALDHVYGYAVGIDLTRRDLQLASRKKERPWEVGKSFDYSAPCSAIQPASKIGHPAKGKIWLTVNGKETQKGDLTELIWSVPEIIWQLSQQVKLAAGDIIMTGTPAGVSQLNPGDNIECGVDGVGTLKVAIGKPE